MQLGLQGLSYFTGFSPFLNWWKLASPPTIWKPDNSTISGPSIWDGTNASGAPFLDATTGDPILPLNASFGHYSRLLYQGPNAVGLSTMQAGGYTAESMVAYCHSDWTINVGNCGTGGGIASGNNTALVNFTIGNGTDAAPLIQVFPVGTPTNPPNVRVCKAAYKSRLDAGEIFDPSWLAIVNQFACLRLMDWNQVNNSRMTDYSQMAGASFHSYGGPCTTASGTPSDNGYHASVPVSVACALANQTDAELHYCIPGRATNAFVDSLAADLKAGTTKVVSFELGNECSWRSGVNNDTNDYFAAQALLLAGNPWGADDAGTRATKYYGYRAAEIMKRISDVYADGTRWRGGLATQSVFAAVTDTILIGVNYYLTNVLGSGSVSTYFKDLFGTSYMGPPFGWIYPTAIEKNSNPQVTTLGPHGFSIGRRVRFYANTGMTQLNQATATVTSVVDSTNFRIDVDTTSFSTWISGQTDSGNNCWIDGVLWDMMANSASLHTSNPATYPTKYTYFNQQLAAAIRTGTSSAGYSVSVDYSLSGQSDASAGSWKLQKDRCTSNGLTFRQYEGGPNWFPGPAMGDSTDTTFNEFFLQWCWSQECADVMYDTYAAFATYGDRSAKFTEGAQLSNKNPWPGLRAVPYDTGNPQWQAVVKWNRGG